MYKKEAYFLTIPSNFLNSEYLESNNLTRKFYVTHLMIDRQKTAFGESTITMKMLLKYVGSTEYRSWSKLFKEFISHLTYMVEKNMIELTDETDLSSVKYNDAITVRIVDLNFYGQSFYTTISVSQFEAIPKIAKSKKVENVLTVLLFMLSRMWRKSKIPSSRPEAYYFGTHLIAKSIGMSTRIVEDCLRILSQDSEYYPSILIKDTVLVSGICKCIYVINEDGYEDHIKRAINSIKKYNPMGEIILEDFC